MAMTTDVPDIELFYVDDNPDDVFLLRYRAREQRLAVSLSIFSNGDEVMREVSRRASQGIEMPKVIIVDLYLPVMDGSEIISRLRSDPSLRGMKICACSGSVDDEDRLRAIRAGADLFLEKPVELPELFSKF